jgi:hypothetical protein
MARPSTQQSLLLLRVKHYEYLALEDKRTTWMEFLGMSDNTNEMLIFNTDG